MKQSSSQIQPDAPHTPTIFQDKFQWIGKYFKYGVLAFIVIIPLFLSLDTMTLRDFDEARLAVSAYEMYTSGNLLIPTFKYSPEMWSTKPPLMIWLQAGCMKIIGVNEWAVRLPSAVAGFLTCAFLLYFSLRYLKNFWFGFIAILVLLTAEGYTMHHGPRTGDYDALLTLLTTMSTLSFFVYCETNQKRYLYGLFATTTLAVLTKSVAGFLFVPALAIYSIIRGQFFPLLKNKHFYIGGLSCLLVVIGYYLLRESVNPGYMQAVWHNELGGRYLKSHENNTGSFWFYYNDLMYLRFTVWYLWVPCGLVLGFFWKDGRISRLALFSGLMAICYFLIISFSKTKLHQYDLPMYPFLALLTATAIYHIFEGLRQFTWINQTMRFNAWPFVFLFLLTFNPYRETLYRTYTPIEEAKYKQYYEIGYLLQGALNGTQDITGYSLLYEGYYAHLLFYMYALKEKGITLNFKDWICLTQNDLVIVPQEEIKQYIRETYEHEVIEEIGTITKFRINGRKN